MNQLPVFEVQKRHGVPCGVGAVAAASAINRERLDLQDLPNPPSSGQRPG